MSERKLKISPLVAPRNHEGRTDKELALERLKKQGYVPRICKEKDE